MNFNEQRATSEKLRLHTSIYVSTIFSFCVFIFTFFLLLFPPRDTLLSNIIRIPNSVSAINMSLLDVIVRVFFLNNICTAILWKRMNSLEVATRLRSCRPQVCNFIKREALAYMFSCEFCEVLKTFCAEAPGDCFWAVYIDNRLIISE